MERAQQRSQRLRCCDYVLSYGFIFSGFNLFQRSFIFDTVTPQLNILKESQDPWNTGLKWLIYTHPGRLLMMVHTLPLISGYFLHVYKSGLFVP